MQAILNSGDQEVTYIRDNRGALVLYSNYWTLEAPLLLIEGLRNAFWYPISHHHIIIVMEICLFR